MNMKKILLAVMLLSVLIFVLSCAKAPATPAPASDTPEVTSELEELDDLGSLSDEVDNDISFEELDNVNLQ